MYVPLIGLALVLYGLWTLSNQTTQAVEEASEKETLTLDALYEKWGRRSGLEAQLLKAIAIVESDQNPNAVNPTDPSSGLMQIWMPLNPDGTYRKRDLLNYPPDPKEQIFDPDYNLSLAVQILGWNQENYGWLRGIAMYNAFSARFDEPNGPFVNQGYVDKVMREYYALTPSIPV